MKLGTETASVSNWMMSGTRNQPAPTVGMGITLLHWTDRDAATITKVSPRGKTFWFQEDVAIRTDKNGISENQTYSYLPNLSAPVRKAILTRSGCWKEVGGSRIRLGDRQAYRDPSF